MGSAPADHATPRKIDATAAQLETLPELLAQAHGQLPVDGAATLRLPDDPAWAEGRLADIVEGAGFAPTDPRSGAPVVALTRQRTLPDRVSIGMRLLVCGLNPSVYSADVGIGFGRPGNRFWPAALAAGLVATDRDPTDALHHHGIGMTDLVKRATPRANALGADEYRAGLARVTRLVEWLAPPAVCFVGLSGWRVAADRHAVAGWQPNRLGDTAVYLMGSTSGLNAHARLEDLTEHLRTAAAAGPR